MKRFLALCGLGIVLFSATLLKDSTLNGRLISDLEHFEKKIIKVSQEGNKANLMEARLAYKKVERYVAYFYPSIEKQLNGAPVMGFIKDQMMADAVDPHGLQVLEELIQEGGNRAEITQEVKLMQLHVSQLKKGFETKRLLGKDVLALNRYELIRVASLGISGYENVQFSDGIKESIVSLKEIKRDFSDFDESEQVISYLNTAIKQLEKSDFESLDRVRIIREALDPCYREVLALYKKTGYEMPRKEVRVPVNFEAESIFSEYFLDNNYYTKFKAATINDEQVDLGKVLFFDPILSANNKRSCASCHNPEKAFTDGRAKSLAFDFEGTVDRNSPTLINASFQSNFFWDMRSEHLEDQVHHVVRSPKEFNSDFDEILSKLRSSDVYVQLFEEAFPHEQQPVNTSNLKNAITSYVKSLSSFNSRFDQYMRGEKGADLTQEEIKGFNIFMGKANCGTCHFVPVFNGTVPPFYGDTDGEVLGVPANDLKTLDQDLGRQAHQLADYKFDFLARMFKTPTIRNIELTSPYMHNGCFKTLDEVMDFYNVGGGIGKGFEVDNQTLSGDSLGLSNQEIQAVIAFMKTLTDNPFAEMETPKLPNVNGLEARKSGGEY